MHGNKLNQKATSKPTRQLLFSEALQHKRLASTSINPQTSSPPTESTTMAEKSHSTTMDRILQEITTVSRRIEGMDASITSITLETKSMRAEIAGFQSRVTGLEQRMGLVEAQTTMSRDRDQDLIYLRSKLTDMEDRSRRDNIRLHGIPENEEGGDVQTFLRSILPKLTLLDFDPPHGPFQLDQYDIRITADYSKETNDRRKAFLALRPRLRQLEIKYGLFDPARMSVTKNGVSKDFYNPEELQLFLDSFQPQSMDSTNTSDSHNNGGDNEGNLPTGEERTDTAQ
ncbi:hypothetical protein NDU88_006179, partial [Pleurodeles waltl]